MTLFPEVLTTARLELRMPDPAVAPAVNEAIRESFDTLSRWMDWADHIPSIEETHARLLRSRHRFMLDAVVADGRVDPDGASSDTHVYVLSREY